MVALVRGVHGLRGAVRVEVLTDRPEERFIPGAVLHREGSDAPLTIAAAEADPRRSGLAAALRRGRRPERRRHAPRRLPRGRRRPRRRARPWASTTGTRSSVRRSSDLQDQPIGVGPRRVPGRRSRGLRRPRRAVRRVRPAGRPRVHPDLRAGAGRDRGRRRRRWRSSRRSRRGRRGRRGAQKAAASTPGAAAAAEPGCRTGAGSEPPAEPPSGPTGRAMTLEIDVLTLFPGMIDGAARRQHPRPDPGAGPRRRSGSTTCASGASASTAASTTTRTAAARA